MGPMGNVCSMPNVQREARDPTPQPHCRSPQNGVRYGLGFRVNTYKRPRVSRRCKEMDLWVSG